MVRLPRLIHAAALALIAGSIVGCSGGGNNSVTPAPPSPQAQPPAAPAAAVGENTSLQPGIMDPTESLWMTFEGHGDFDKGELALTPVTVDRQGQLTPVGNDMRALDASPFLTEAPCTDCFRVKGLSLDGNNNLQVDFALRHPFPDKTKRADLDVFDPLAIFVTNGAVTFNGLDRIDEDGNGSADGRPQTNPKFIANPTGYTMRHDALVRTLFPNKNYTGNVNPYVAFFTENDASATGVGTEIPWHKFGMAPTDDVKRVTFLNPGGG
ncbi:MAG: hypothetical protein ABI743_12655, partial [bacterium]